MHFFYFTIVLKGKKREYSHTKTENKYGGNNKVPEQLYKIVSIQKNK